MLIGAQATTVGPSDKGWTELMIEKRSTGFHHIVQAVICLNPNVEWRFGEPWDDVGRQGKLYSLAYALTHEFGHVIGLDHPDADGGIMGFKFPSEGGFTPIVRQAGTFLYGPPQQ